MKQLIWKELMEIKWIGLALVVAPLVLMAWIGSPLTYLNYLNPEPFSAGVWVSLGFLLGATAYSRELAWDTPRFICSRPIRWWQWWIVFV